MKKYFMKGTEEELQFGDVIELDLTKEMENGHTKHHHLECKFVPELLPLLLESEVIEVREDEDEQPKDNGPLDFDFNQYEELIECYSALNDSVDILAREVRELKEVILGKNAKAGK